MTLITYTTRVHFADGVLEEAMRSELEVNNKKRPLVLVEKNLDDSDQEMLQRLYSCIPKMRDIHQFDYVNDLPLEQSIHEIAEKYQEENCDILLALGSNNIIDVGKISRVAIAHGGTLSKFTIAEGGSRRIGEKLLPDLFAVPNIHGFCSAVSAHAKLVLDNGVHARLMCRKLVPTVTICDPTLTSGVDNFTTASVGVDAIARCLEAYLSPNYNPPADGIAYDGLRRAVEYLPKVLKTERAEYRREMMAASLNSALALQKGLGTTQVIGDGLQEACKQHLDLGSIRRVLLPKVIKNTKNKNPEKIKALCQLFVSKEQTDVAQSVESYFSDLPLSSSISDLGIDSCKMGNAAEIASVAMSVAPGLEPIESTLLKEMMAGAG